MSRWQNSYAKASVSCWSVFLTTLDVKKQKENSQKNVLILSLKQYLQIIFKGDRDIYTGRSGIFINKARQMGKHIPLILHWVKASGDEHCQVIEV